MHHSAQEFYKTVRKSPPATFLEQVLRLSHKTNCRIVARQVSKKRLGAFCGQYKPHIKLRECMSKASLFAMFINYYYHDDVRGNVTRMADIRNVKVIFV